MLNARREQQPVWADADERVYFRPERDCRDAVEGLFARVAARIGALLPNADIQHVGSTAIPGSLTKGDLDVQVRVVASDYAAAKAQLSAMYAVNSGGFSSDDAISFEAHDTEPSVGVHLTIIGGAADIQWRFRDLLIASPELRAKYDGRRAVKPMRRDWRIPRAADVVGFAMSGRLNYRTILIRQNGKVGSTSLDRALVRLARSTFDRRS
jgi:GrpB-like predicted nucleotidyltransferase (UPF0157 family)